MSNTQVALAAGLVLVTALVVVEHDREKHIPGVTSGPNAETFQVPAEVAESLIRAGVVKLTEVVDADELFAKDAWQSGTHDLVIEAQDTSLGQSLTFADVGDMVEADGLRVRLAEALSRNQSLADQLAFKQTELDTAHAQLETAHAKLGIVHARLAEATGTADQAATGTADQAATGTADQAAASTADQAATGTADQAATGTADQAATGTADQAATGTADQAATGTADQAAASTADQAAASTADQVAASTKAPAAKTSGRKAS